MDGKKIVILALLIAFLLFGLSKFFFQTASTVHERPDSSDLVIKVLDIGQGDAILIFTGKDTILVDSGDADMQDKLVQLLKREGVKTIDLLVSTHPHSDHIGGMQAVLNNFRVEHVLDSGQVHTTATLRNYLQLIEKKKIPFTKAVKDTVYYFDNDVTIKVLWPEKKFLVNTSSDLNNNSIVLLVQKGDFGMLLTGDIQSGAEKILSSGSVQATVLKAPHHGSRTSSTNAFLRSVGADAVVISCGSNNSYGFPHEQIVKRYVKNDMSVYVTAEAGTVTVITDGKKYHIESER